MWSGETLKADVCAVRTRVLVTNQLQFTKEADLIVYLADGKVEECGPYAELMAADGGYAKLMSQAEVQCVCAIAGLNNHSIGLTSV